MKKPGKKRIEQLVGDVSFATRWGDVADDNVENTYLAPLLARLKEAEREFEEALENEMEKHDVEYS